MTNEYRHQIDVRETYKGRPQYIERIFADDKMKYGLRKTYFTRKMKNKFFI